MAVTPADVRAFAPETAGQTDAFLQLWLDAGATFAPAAAFGSDADLAIEEAGESLKSAEERLREIS